MTTAVVLMGKDEARKFTDKLKARIQRHGREQGGIIEALREAEEGELWKTLGYASMARYITVEFGYSRSNAYNILDQFKHAKRLSPTGEVSSAGQLPPQRESAEARREPLKDKRPKRGPQGLNGQLATIERATEAIDAAFESAGDDALVYLPPEDRRALERTVTKTFEWAQAWAERLATPVEAQRQQVDWGAA